MSSFGSPNKVISLSQWNTASPGHGAGSNNSTARIKITPSFFAYTFGRCYANLPTQWRRHVGACLNEPFRGAWTSLNFYKENLLGFETLVFATLGISSMHEQLVTLEIASYDPVKLCSFLLSNDKEDDKISWTSNNSRYLFFVFHRQRVSLSGLKWYEHE